MADQIKTVVSAEVILPGVEAANQQLELLLKNSKNLSKDLKQQVQEFSQALSNYRNAIKNGAPEKAQNEALEAFNAALIKIQGTMKNQSLMSKGMFSNAEASNVSNFVQLINKLAKAFDELKRQSQIERGTFGIDSKNIKEAQSALKALDDQLKAHQFLMENSGATKALEKQVALINKNKEAVADLVKSFEAKKKAEETAALRSDVLGRANIAAEQASAKAENQRIQEKRQAIKDMFAELRQANQFGLNLQQGKTREKMITAGYDSTDIGQQAGVNRAEASFLRWQTQASKNYLDAKRNLEELNREQDKFKASSDYISSKLNRLELSKVTAGYSALPEVFGARTRAVQRKSQEEILRDIYGEHKYKGGSFAGYNVKDSEAVRSAIDQIIFKQKELISLRLQGLRDLNQERKILEEIAKASHFVDQQRMDDKVNDPEHQKRQVANMLGRVTGPGGSALLQVQAMLAINYQLLSAFQNIIGSAVSNTIEFEAALKNMQAVSGATNAEMGSLESTIRRVSSSTKFSATELADSAQILAQAGLSAREIEKALPSIATLATATGSSLAQAVDIATSVIGVFDKSVGDLPDIANKISATMNMSKANAESLRLGLQYVGSTAKETGISLEEILATMGSLSNTGIKSGSTLGTGIRQVITEMQKPSQEFIDSLSRIGLTFADVDIRTNGWVNSLRKLKEAGFVASDAIKSFDVRGAASFNAALTNFKDIERIMEGFSAQNMASDANAIQMDSLQSQLLKLNNNFTNLITSSLTPLGNMLKAIVSGVSSAVQALEPLSGAFAVLGTAIGATALTLIPIWTFNLLTSVPAIKAVTDSVVGMTAALSASSIRAGFAALSAELTQLQFLFGVAASRAGTFAAISVVLQEAMAGLFSVIAAHPIGALVVGVTAAIALFSSFSSASERLKEKIDQQTTALNDSKAASERHSESLKKIEDATVRLAEKEDFLRAGKLSLKDAAIDVNMVIGEFGEKIDTTNPKIEEMANALARVRDRILQIKAADLKTIAGQAENTAADYREQAEQQARAARRSVKGEFLGDSSASSMELFSRLMADPRFAKLAAANGENISSLQGLQSYAKGGNLISGYKDLPMANAIMMSLRDKNGASDIMSKEDWNKVIKSFTGINESIRKASDLDNLSEKSSREASTLNGVREYIRKNPLSLTDINGQNQTLSIDALNARAGSLASRAAEMTRSQGFNPAVDADRNEQNARILGKEVAGAARQAMDKLDREKSGLDPEVYNQIRTMLIGVQSTASGKVAENAKLYGTSLDRSYESQIFTLKKQQEDALKKGEFSPPTLTKGVEASLFENLKKQKVLDERKRTRGKIEGTEEFELEVERNNREYIEKQTELERKISQIRTKGHEAANKSVDQAAGKAAEFYRLSAEVRLKELSPYSTLEDISKAIEDGLIDMKKAGDKEILKLKAERDEKLRKGFSSDQLDLLEKSQAQKNTEAARAFREKGLNIYEQAVFQTYGHKDSFDNRAATLDSMKRGLELSSFNQSAGTQALDKQIAGSQGKYNQSTSTGAIENLQFQRDQMESQILQLKASQLQPLISESSKAVQEAQEALAEVQEKIETEKKLGASEDIIHNLKKAETLVQQRLATFAKDELEAKKQLLDTETKIQSLKVVPGKRAELDDLKANVEEAWQAYGRTIEQMDVNKVIGDGMLVTLRSSTGALGQAMSDIATKSKSVGEAFKDMARGIIKAMLDIVAQAVAMNAVKGLFSAFGFSFGTTSAAATSSSSAAASSTTMAGDVGMTTAAVGGQAFPGGFMYSSTPVQRFAFGGPVRGGRAGRDSVPALLMPGEFVVKKKVVDSIGSDFFHGLNQNAGSVVQSSENAMGSSKEAGGGGVVNVWVVTPDQKPNSMGPKDIVAIVSDDISRGGSVRKMIKQVQMGNA